MGETVISTYCQLSPVKSLEISKFNVHSTFKFRSTIIETQHSHDLCACDSRRKEWISGTLKTGLFTYDLVPSFRE